jgi:hypothetical protein
MPMRIAGSAAAALALLAAAALSQASASSPPAKSGPPLEIRVAWAATVTGFGRYELPASTVFHPNEQVHVYVEPINYGFQPTNNGFHVEIAANVRILRPDGTAIARQDDLSRLGFDAPTEQRDFARDLTVTLPSLRPGMYQLELTLYDFGTAMKSAPVILPFSVMP